MKAEVKYRKSNGKKTESVMADEGGELRGQKAKTKKLFSNAWQNKDGRTGGKKIYIYRETQVN